MPSPADFPRTLVLNEQRYRKRGEGCAFLFHQSLITSHDLWTFVYLGFFGVSVNQLCFTLGLRHTSVTHSSIIVGMAPIYTLALALLLHLEHLTWAKALGMTIAFSGVAILAFSTGMSHHSPTLLGDAIAMCGSLGFYNFYFVAQSVILAESGKPATFTKYASRFFFFGSSRLEFGSFSRRSIGSTQKELAHQQSSQQPWRKYLFACPGSSPEHHSPLIYPFWNCRL